MQVSGHQPFNKVQRLMEKSVRRVGSGFKGWRNRLYAIS
jgi:hypothetical protein